MTKLKKILLTLLITFIMLLSTGCASIEYERVLNTDGTILDAVCVKLDNEKITTAGFNLETVKTEIKSKMNLYITAIIQSFYNRDDGLLDIEKISVYNNITTTVTEKNDYIIASIKFRNYNTFKYFYGLHLDNDDNDNTKTIEEFLYNKNVSAGKTIFSTSDAEFITNEFLCYFDNNFTINNAELLYSFGTPESKLHSDANYKFTHDGVYYHQWVLNDVNQDITTYTYQMKPINWYILALILTFIFIIVLFIISLFQKKKVELKNH